MIDNQIEQLVSQVRKNESHVESLTNTLLGFNDNFSKMLKLLEETTGLGELKTGIDQMECMMQVLGRLDEALETHQIEEKEQFENLQHQIQQVSGCNEGWSEVAIEIEGFIYIRSSSHQAVIKYNKADHTQKVIFEGHGTIERLIRWQCKLWIQTKNEGLYDEQGKNIYTGKVRRAVPYQQGLLFTNDQNELLVYEKEEIKVIATSILDFETIDKNYLICYKEQDTKEIIGMIKYF